MERQPIIKKDIPKVCKDNAIATIVGIGTAVKPPKGVAHVQVEPDAAAYEETEGAWSIQAHFNEVQAEISEKAAHPILYVEETGEGLLSWIEE
jgi:hypothetical protein